MAPRLAASQLEFIRDMIISKSLTTSQIAKAAGCSKRSITNIRSNLQLFGNVRAPPIGGGRPRIITPIMLDALRDRLKERPDLYLDEMVEFLWEEFDARVSTFTIGRALRLIGWSRKATRQVAKEGTQTCGIGISITCQSFVHIIWSM
jgi:transposase